MNNGRTVLTTGEVAKICHVAPRTVSKWFDSGQLKGYRIPGSKDRRIPLDQLIRFMQVHGMPLEGLDNNHLRVLVFDADPTLCEAIRTRLTEREDYQVAIVDSAFEAGVVAYDFKPHVIVVDVTLPDVMAARLRRQLQTYRALQHTRLIGTAVALTEGQDQALLQDGFDGYLRKPFDVDSLAALIESSTTQNLVESQP